MNSDEKKSSLSKLPSASDGKDSKSLFSDNERDYGMPNYGFPEDNLPDPFAKDSYVKKAPPQDTIAEVEANLDMPLGDGTGWESKASVIVASTPDKTAETSETADDIPEKGPQTLADISADETLTAAGNQKIETVSETGNQDDDLELFADLPDKEPLKVADIQEKEPEKLFEVIQNEPPEEELQANVMPFPGNAIPRASNITSNEFDPPELPVSSEIEPSELLRGAEDSDLDDFLDSAPVAYDDPIDDYESDEQDSIADAVQSALKNVYGNESSEPANEPAVPDFGQFSVAESLRQDAAAQAASQGAYWDDEDDASPAPQSHVEAESETVLDYLYSNRRAATERQQEPHAQQQDDYSGYGASNLDSGAGYFESQEDKKQKNFDNFDDDPDWTPPSFVTSAGPAPQPGQYPAPMPTTAPTPESLAVGSPDSSHLLGAAGLGLIGGIALAGVLAVFVFNSFVEDNEPTVSASLSAPKVIDRLDGDGNDGTAVVSSQATSETAIPGPNVPPIAPETRSAAVEPSRVEPAAPAAAPEPEKPLNAFDVAGLPGTDIPLSIKLSAEAGKEAALISLKGLDENYKLSTGIDVGAGQWLLPPARLDTLTVSAPEALTGTFDIEIQLLEDDAQTPMSDPISFKLTIDEAPKRSEQTSPPETSVAALSGTSEEANQLVEVTEATPEIDTDPLTQLLIRDGNKLMREGDILGARRLYEQAVANGNPEAALAMGRSYDPSYFEKLPIQTGKPDPATAFQWYKQALDGGLVTARVKIDGLKQWLQN